MLLCLFAQCAGPSPGDGGVVRFATLNVALNRRHAGDLCRELAMPGQSQASAIAEIIQRLRPDVVLLNEFDWDAAGAGLAGFERNYLAVSQNGAPAVSYPYRFTAPVNTGMPSGFDLDNDGRTDGPGDAFGFGHWPGQYGMVLLSRFPIVEDEVRTFRDFRWQDMPAARIPDGYYTDDERAALRLSSKSHWDLPLRIGTGVVHVLASHPTPPVFDGVEDRNGRRNHDEIRLFADYIDAARSGYVYDDRGRRGGLVEGASFVIAGDLNADPVDGDGTAAAIAQLLDHRSVRRVDPKGVGGSQRPGQRGDPATRTAHWPSGDLRVDYVLPSRDLLIADSGVFWPAADEPLGRLVGGSPPTSSDHRLVWVDVRSVRFPGGARE